jgi:two-component system nitrogen regulation sensor histidine kinase NtrY
MVGAVTSLNAADRSSPRPATLTRWRLVWLASVAAAAALAPEWMRAPGWILAAGLVALALLGGIAVWREASGTAGRGVRVVATVLVAALAAVACHSTWRLGRLQRTWPSLRERVVTEASRELDRDLGESFAAVRHLADEAAGLVGEAPREAFRRLAGVAREAAPARGVVLFDPLGRPNAWAGALRVPVSATGPELSTVTTPFYLWLVARRQALGGTAVAAVLLARASYAPRAGVALTDQFSERSGVGLRFYQGGTAPADSDVFDYILPRGLSGGDTLFAVQPLPPEQDAALSDQLAAGRRAVFWLVFAALLAGMMGAVRAGLPTAAVLVAAPPAALMLARAPLGEAFGAGSIFSAATYYQDVLGPFSASAGAVILTGFAVSLLACALWRRGLRPSLLSYLAALGVTVLAPYLLQDLARGITPPASGVSLGLWLTWQVGLVISASALVLFAAALIRGPATPAHGGLWPYLASALAVALAVAGLFLWEPRGAWPEWYPYLWLPALLVAIKPMPFRSTIATVAVVAGSSAALLEWGTTTESRISLATQDLEGLGSAPDPLKVALFDRLLHAVPPTIEPRTAGDLYLLWRRSDFAARDYPAALSLWSADARRLLELDLAQLDLPAGLVQEQVREAVGQQLPLVRSYLRNPGMYGLATIPLTDGQVLAVGVGPRTRLVAPTRVARFLAGVGEEPEPPYRLAISPREPVGAPATTTATWVRAGWTIRGERVVDLPGGRRHVHGQVDLGGLSPLLQRGLLLLVLDFGVLAALWLVVDVVSGRLVPGLRAWVPRVRRSLRARLTLSLAAFFVVPTVALAVWSYERQGDEFRRSRELLIVRTLRDAGSALEDASLDPGLALGEIAHNVDAELVLSRGGALVASSAPVLADLGLVDWLVPPGAFTRLAYGDYLELTREQQDTPQPVLVGYRLLGYAEPSEVAILASPNLLTDEALGAREEDLGIAVIVAAVVGIVAAIVLSGLAARALARPLGHLARAALVAGGGERPAPPVGPMPSELEPVYEAIEQAAADVEKGQEAQRVLAWGEMARQVAHEIKNPLTPIRLGIQHLMRLHRERPAELGGALDGTGRRILAEIGRLDAIARAFSRFALPTSERGPVEVVDATEVVHEVVGLYQLGQTAVRWEVEAEGRASVLARRDELVEVLVNLFENARDAGATGVVVRVAGGGGGKREAGSAGGTRRLEVHDDGRGIPAELLMHVFEPRFSTTTSGSGLGLAIAKRLVEGWGGTITIDSAPGAGTTVTIRLAGPAPPGPA